MPARNSVTSLREYLAAEGKVELSLGCLDIPKMDLMTKSDPFCVIYTRNASGWEKLGTTETIQDTSACKWVWKLSVDETTACSELKFELYDRDSNRDDLRDHDFIGSVEGKVIASMLDHGVAYQKFELERKDGKKSSGWLSLTLDWLEKQDDNFDVAFDVSVDCHPRRKLYYQLLRKCCDTPNYVLVSRSNVLDKKGCRFEESKFSILELGGTTRQLRIELFEVLAFARCRNLGFVRTTVQELLEAGLNTPLAWIPSDKNGFRNPMVSVTQDRDSTVPYKQVYIHVSG